MIERENLLEAHGEAAEVLRRGAELVAEFSRGKAGKVSRVGQDRARLGRLIAHPSEFWAVAASVEAQGDAATAEAVALSVKLAASRLAVGDFEFVRESLLGQAVWASAVAVRMVQKAATTRNLPAEVQMLKLALAAQRQASATLATAAALNKIADANGVTVGGGV